MSDATFLSHRGTIIAGGIIVIFLIVFAFLIEPVTRNYVAADRYCVKCHIAIEYLHSTRLSQSSTHPPEPTEDQNPTQCVDCHLPEGIWASVYTYTHYVSVTDLYGHFRDREGERSGDWIPLSAARAYRVRDRMMEYDSPTCQSCHNIAEIELDSIRAQKSHDDAQKNAETCIECHMNLVHREIEPRPEPVEADEGFEAEGGDEFGIPDEFGGPDEFGESDDWGDDFESDSDDFEDEVL